MHCTSPHQLNFRGVLLHLGRDKQILLAKNAEGRPQKHVGFINTSGFNRLLVNARPRRLYHFLWEIGVNETRSTTVGDNDYK